MTDTVPTLLWPSQAALTPKQCPFCGSGFVCPNPPDGQYRTGETTCGICTRTICTYREDGFTATASLVTRRDASPSAALCTLCGNRPPAAGRRICQSCRNQQMRDRERAKRSPEETARREAARQSDAAYRERIKAGQPRSRWATGYDACVACGGTTRQHHARGVCYGCRDRSHERKHYRGALAEVAS